MPLLAVRMLGGRSVPEDDPALKEVKKSLAEAVAEGWVRRETVKVPDPSKPAKRGKPATKNRKVVHLTEDGERVLRQAARPEDLATTSAGVIAGLREGLEADRQALRGRAEAALASAGDGELAAEFGRLSKAVEGLAAKVERLESLVAGARAARDLPAQIDLAFAAMLARLESALGGLPPGAEPPTPAPSHPAGEAGGKGPARLTAGPEPPGGRRLRDVLHAAYERLCHFREFEDGMVELPRLFHEARKKLPGLTVEEFHRELDELWSGREVSLHILNEVGRASEPDKALRRDDALYYYVFWNRP